jgi:hypothetical protein
MASLSQSFDRFGSRWNQSATAGSGPSSSLSFGSNGMNSSTTNQPNLYTYDPSGNMTVEPFASNNYYTYDGENRMTAFSGYGGTATYTYDGSGIRVIKASGGTTMVSIYAGSVRDRGVRQRGKPRPALSGVHLQSRGRHDRVAGHDLERSDRFRRPD